MIYPNSVEYIEAILNGSSAFKTLKNLEVELNNEGKPIMIEGSSSIIFQFYNKDNNKEYAIRCFLEDVKGRNENLKKNQNEIKKIKSSHVLQYDYLDEEIIVNSKKTSQTTFPIIIMEWNRWNRTLRSICNSNHIGEYTIDFLYFAKWVSEQDFIHGNITPDNIILNEKGFVLIDCDTMYFTKSKYANEENVLSVNDKYIYDKNRDILSLSLIAFSMSAAYIDPTLLSDKSNLMLFEIENLEDYNNKMLLEKLKYPLNEKICHTIFSLIRHICENPNLIINDLSMFDSKNYYHANKLLYIPYKCGEHQYLIYNTNKEELDNLNVFSDVKILNYNNNIVLIVSYGGEIDYSSYDDLGPGPIRVTDMVKMMMKMEKPKANKFALVSENTDLSNLKWFCLIKPISFNVFLVKDENENYGIISRSCEIIIPIIYKSITPLVINNSSIYLLCETKDNKKGVYFITKETRPIKIIECKYDTESIHYKDGASKPDNIIIFHDEKWKGIDLENSLIFNLPKNLKRVLSYSEYLLGVEVWEKEGIRLYNVIEEQFINSTYYTAVGYYKDEKKPFKNGLSICSTYEHKNVIVYNNGINYIIPYEEQRLHVSKQYVFYCNEYISNGYGKDADIKITLFDLRVNNIKSFIHKWNSYGMRGIWVKDDKYVEVCSHNSKYNLTSRVALYDLNGQKLSSEEIEDKSVKLKLDFPCKFDNNLLLKQIVENKFVNKDHIKDIEKYYDGVQVVSKDCYAEVWGILDVDPEFGTNAELIGYADTEKCYWPVS